MASTNVTNTSSTMTLARLNAGAYVMNSVIVYGVGMGLLPGFRGRDNASISHAYQTLVTPADWAFGIWGVIYTAQLLWVGWLLQRCREDAHQQCRTGAVGSETDSRTRQTPHDRILQAVGYNYVDACVAQIVWTFFFSAEQMTLSFCAMLSILLSLSRAVQEIRKVTDVNYWIYKFPLTSHFGWILAATALNFNVTLVGWKLSSSVLFGASLATLCLLLFEALFMTWRLIDWTVPVIMLWALIGIYVELKSPRMIIAANFNNRQIDAVQWTSKIGSSILAAAVIGKALLTKLGQQQQPLTHRKEAAVSLKANN